MSRRAGVTLVAALLVLCACGRSQPAISYPGFLSRSFVSGLQRAVDRPSVSPAPTGTASERIRREIASEHCPKPQPLVSRIHWRRTRLAKGVTLSEGGTRDHSGTVNLHVLRVSPGSPNLRFAPLMSVWTQRSPLSSLADPHPRLVAATNTGFYDFFDGAPDGPVVDRGGPLSLGAQPRRVIGLTSRNRVESGKVALDASVTAGNRTERVAGIDDLTVRRGLAIYNARWGEDTVPFLHSGSSRSLSALVVSGRVVHASGHIDVPPQTGRLLVASSPQARRWIRALHVGEVVHQSLHVVTTDAASPFAQAYGVDLQLLRWPGKPIPTLGCDERDPQAARTAVGIASGGKQLIIAVAADHPGTALHGLDHVQMAHVMRQLGAEKAWEWDGSGSSEMIARISGVLSIRNYCADGVQRIMPVGFGIFTRRARLPHRHG